MDGEWIREAILLMGFFGAMGGLWWRLEQIKKSAENIASWRQKTEDRLASIETELQRGGRQFDEHRKTDKEILSCLQEVKLRLTRIETTLAIKLPIGPAKVPIGPEYDGAQGVSR